MKKPKPAKAEPKSPRAPGAARPWRLAEVTLADVREFDYQAAVLPVGALEPHNLHLPYGTDAAEVSRIADAACAEAWTAGARVALLPTVPYGVDRNMLAFPMTIHVPQEVLDRILLAVVESLDRHGVRKLVLLNGHGGNEFRGAIRELVGKTSVFVCMVEWWKMMADVSADLFEHGGEHASETETSLMLSIAPSLVRLERADKGWVRPTRFEAMEKGCVFFARPWEKFTVQAGVGDPRKGTREKGQRYIAAAAARIGKFLAEFASAPMDDDFPFRPDALADPDQRPRV